MVCHKTQQTKPNHPGFEFRLPIPFPTMTIVNYANNSFNCILNFSKKMSFKHKHQKIPSETWINLLLWSLISCGCRIHLTTSPQRVKTPTLKYTESDTELDLMVRLQSWRFGKCGVLLYCHYSLVHSDLEWCDDTPSAPLNTSTSSKPFYFLAGDQLVVPIGASHISS